MNRKPKRVTRAKAIPSPSPSSPGLFITSDAHVGKYGEIFSLSDNSGQTPVSGNSYYIFLEQTTGRATLFHPFSKTKFQMDIPLFLGARGQNDWNPTPARLSQFLNKKITEWKSLKRDVPNYILLLVKHYEKLADDSI